jgi:hypothetical protein
MSSAQKTPYAYAINNFASNKIAGNNQRQGQSWPCHVTAVQGQIVTCKFDLEVPEGITLPPVTCPVATSVYIRLPVQVGDKGFLISADTRLGIATGLGTGLSEMNLPTNMGALVYVPIGNTGWSAVDPNALNLNAPNGVVLRDTNNQCTYTQTPTGITIAVGGTTITVDGSTVNITTSSAVNMTVPNVNIDGNLNVTGLITGQGGFNISGGSTTAQVTGNVDIIGTLTNNGKNVGSTHTHTGVQSGGGTSGPPT